MNTFRLMNRQVLFALLEKSFFTIDERERIILSRHYTILDLFYPDRIPNWICANTCIKHSYVKYNIRTVKLCEVDWNVCYTASRTGIVKLHAMKSLEKVGHVWSNISLLFVSKISRSTAFVDKQEYREHWEIESTRTGLHKRTVWFGFAEKKSLA